MMKAILLHNWKAKIASLLLAVAIWFLIRLSIPDPAGPQFPVPGTSPPSPVEPVTPIPGTPVGSVFPPACEEVVSMVRAGLFRLHWFESPRFTASLTEYPPRAIV